uniref:Uncharacterized protein n=1 Tax=Arundo donax TaxID=35708 RepID=A0A0A9ECZ3_ARUDO
MHQTPCILVGDLRQFKWDEVDILLICMHHTAKVYRSRSDEVLQKIWLMYIVLGYGSRTNECGPSGSLPKCKLTERARGDSDTEREL